MDKLFDYLDRDSDGVLSQAEAAAAPTPAMLSSPLASLFRRAAPTQLAPRKTRAGQMTRAELAAYYRQNGLVALKIADQKTLGGQLRILLNGFSEEATAEQLTDRLFQLLDTDKDGQLSRKELEAAPEILGKVDVDVDDMITTAELMGEASSADRYPAVVVAGRGRSEPPSRLLHVAAEGRPDVELAKLLLLCYGKPGQTSLKPSALRLSKEALAVLDRDGDGVLSMEELSRLGRKPADVTLTVHLGNRSDKPLIAMSDDKALPAGVRAKVTDQGVILQVGNNRLDLALSRQVNQARMIDVRAQVKTLFRRADMDNDGFVDRMEADRTGFFRGTFDVIDRDHNGKISEKEMMTYLDEMAALQKQVERSCVSLAITNEGQGLFELFDTNRDGKLSLRELRNAHKLLNRLPPGRDQVTRFDIPRHHRAGLALGPNAGGGPLGRTIAPAVRGGTRSGARHLLFAARYGF